MKTYKAIYESPGNMESGEVVIKAETIVEAQDKFFGWLRTKDLYRHMWRLELRIIEFPSFEIIE